MKIMLQDTRDWYGMGYQYPSSGMGYSPYTSGYGHHHPSGMTGYHYHDSHHHHPHHHHPFHDGVIQSQSVLINMPGMMHGMKHK
ncbi:hypothetical protein ACWF7H_23580 [Peribacillus butanolivorans]